MALRRLFSSYFFISHNGDRIGKVKKLGWCPKSYSFDVPSFNSQGGNQTINLSSGKRWVIDENLDWLSVNYDGGKSGNYELTFTAEENGYTRRTGNLTARTVDNRYRIVLNIEQEAKGQTRRIEIVPVEGYGTSIDALGTTYLKCFLYVNDNAPVDITTAATWSPATNDYITLSKDSTNNREVVTGKNNTDGAKTVQVTASYDGLTDDIDINVGAGVVTWALYFSPENMTGASGVNKYLDSGDTAAGRSYVIMLDKIINGTVTAQTQTLTGQLATYITALTTNSTAITTDKVNNGYKVYPVYDHSEPGTYYPSDRAGKVIANYSRDGVNLSAEMPVTVGAEGLVEHIIVVTPNPVSLPAHGAQQFTATYYDVVDGVRAQTGTDITTVATYGGTTSVITISGREIQSNNTSTTQATATITVNYGDAPQVNVPVTAEGEVVVDAHIYVNEQPDSYSVTLRGGSFAEEYTLTWDADVNPATLGYNFTPGYDTDNGGLKDVEINIDTTDEGRVGISGNKNISGIDLVGTVYITALTFDNRAVTCVFTVTHETLEITRLAINGSTEKYLMVSGQMISFEVQDQNGNTMTSGRTGPGSFTAAIPRDAQNHIAAWGYDRGKAWIISKVDFGRSIDYTVTFESSEDANVCVDCTVHCVPFGLTATPDEFPQTGGNGTLSIVTYGNYYWSIADNPLEQLDLAMPVPNTGYGNTNGIRFNVGQNPGAYTEDDYIATITLTDEYGNSLTGETSATIYQDEYSPTPVQYTDAYIVLCARTENSVTVNTGLIIRYDNHGDMNEGDGAGASHNDFSVIQTSNDYRYAEADIIIFGHIGESSTQMLANGDTELLATMKENETFREVSLLGNDDRGQAYNAFNPQKNIVETFGRVSENNSFRLTIDDIQFVTEGRGKTLHATSFSPSTFTVSYANPVAKITDVTFEDDYERTLWTTTTAMTVGGNAFHFTANHGKIDTVSIRWDVPGLAGFECNGQTVSNGGVVVANGSSGTLSFTSTNAASGSGKIYVTSYYLGVKKEQFEIGITYNNPDG